jgi:SAM-dependent methyltransferase
MAEEILDKCLRRLEAGRVRDGMLGVVFDLCDLRLDSELEDWKSWVETECLTHPVFELIHQDPFTARSYDKPRGYAGDAIMLDMIYFPERTDFSQVTELGRAIYGCSTQSDATHAVRWRRELLARKIDEVAEATADPDVLSLACGHLREIELSQAAEGGRLGRYVALDQDPNSVSEVEELYGDRGVEAIKAPVKALMAGEMKLGELDFIYSAGLYDYLDRDTARFLTAGLFQMLRPGGKLLVANFLPGISDIGYMESFMAWQLIFRSREDMLALLAPIPEQALASKEIYTDDLKNIIFLEIDKAGG